MTSDDRAVAAEAAAELARVLREQELFRLDDDVVRVPHLVRGRLVAPPELPHRRIRSAFTAAGAGTRHLRLDGAQVIAEPVVDRRPGRPGTVTDRYRFLVLPDCDPLDLVEWDLDRLATGPYATPYDTVVDLLDATAALLSASPDLLSTLLDLVLATSPHRAETLTAHLTALPSTLDGLAVRTTADRQLSAWGHPGTAYLDGWVPLPGPSLPDPLAPLTAKLAGGTTGSTGSTESTAAGAVMRAAPTRQVHLAADQPLGAVTALLRLLGSKGAGTVRLPVAGVLPGALVAAALTVAAGVNHPMLRHLSVVHWRDGDPAVEALLLAPESFDRVVDGRTDRGRRPVALIDLSTVEAGGDAALAEVAALAAVDVCRGELAGDPAPVHYVVGSREIAERYATALREALLAWDDTAAPVVSPELAGRLAGLRRGRLAQASWHPDPLRPDPLRPDPLRPELPGGEASGAGATGSGPTVVVTGDGVASGELPGGGLVVVRVVGGVREAVGALGRRVGSVAVWPDEVRVAVRDRVAARGVGRVVGVGDVGRFAGEAEGGELALERLVDWTRG